MKTWISINLDRFPGMAPLTSKARAGRACGYTIAALLSVVVAAPSYADSAASETEKGTALIMDMIMQDGESKETAQASTVSAAQAADSLKISESEEVIDVSTLTPEERAQLNNSVDTWVNEAASPAPAGELVEMVEPVQVRESSEQVVDADSLTPEQIAEFPAMKTAPLPVAKAPVEPKVTEVAAEAESTEAEATEAEAPKKAARAPVSMPRVTRWGGRPSGN